jgi:hypothetical protein
MSKNFYILEARRHDGHLAKRKIYTTDKQYNSEGHKQIQKLSKYYSIKVTKYICAESVEILKPKEDERM